MFSPILVATALATWQADDPIARLARYMEGATHYTTTFVVSDGKMAKIADCNWEFLRPNTQKFTAKNGDHSLDFIQTPEGTVYFEHFRRQYIEWPVINTLVDPPPAAGVLSDIYPGFLLNTKRLQQFKWSAPKPTEINGKKVDEVVAQEKGQGEITINLFVDEVGRAMRMHVKITGQTGTKEFTYDFATHDRLTTSENKISSRLPEGYVPYQVSPPRSTVTSPNAAPATTLLDANGANPTKLDFKGKTTVIVFTAPECDVSKSMQKTLAKAYATYGKQAQFAEVSLGSEKPSTQGRTSGIPLHWDKNGVLEESWGINYTPYVLIIDKKGIVNRGFGGFGPDQEAAFLKTIKAGLAPAEDE